jgi:hypothetical protein
VGECEGVIFDSCSIIVTTALGQAKPEFKSTTSSARGYLLLIHQALLAVILKALTNKSAVYTYYPGYAKNRMERFQTGPHLIL